MVCLCGSVLDTRTYRGVLADVLLQLAKLRQACTFLGLVSLVVPTLPINQNNLLVLSRECGIEHRDSLKGNHRGWFIRVILSFPAERQQDNVSQSFPVYLDVSWSLTMKFSRFVGRWTSDLICA